jgi:hypothetical protein
MPQKANKPRREIIYPHRSFRHLRFQPLATFTGFALATLLSFGVVAASQPLADLHQQLASLFTQLAGVTEGGQSSTATVFPKLLQAEAPPVRVPLSSEVPDLMRLPALAAALATLFLSRRNTITRGFFYFLLILLMGGTIALTLLPRLHVNAETVTQIWLRSALPVWLLMPWFASFLFIVINPAWRMGIVWTLGVMLHLFWTSALRQAFLLAVMHYTGIVFFPLLWFLFGFLFDMLVLLVFYSLSLNNATLDLWGHRQEALA